MFFWPPLDGTEAFLAIADTFAELVIARLQAQVRMRVIHRNTWGPCSFAELNI
jgi:hypothetical protein